MKKRWLLGICLGVVLLAQMPIQRRAVSAEGPAALPEAPKYVALTFDDGPHPIQTARLLDGLSERDAKTTFFLVGENLAGNEALVQRMAREGHQVGNHTWSHQSLEKISEEAFQQELNRTDTVLREILGSDAYWIRPPYGQLTSQQLGQVDVPLVKWSVDPRDWESRDKDRVVQAVLEAIQPGSIILLHDIYDSSVSAALELVDQLQEMGYVFVTVEELLLRSGIQPQPGVLYRSAPSESSVGSG